MALIFSLIILDYLSKILNGREIIITNKIDSGMDKRAWTIAQKVQCLF